MLSKAEHWGDSDVLTRSVNHYIWIRPRVLAVNVTVAVNGVLPPRDIWPIAPGGFNFSLFNIGSAQWTIRAANLVLVGVILPGFNGRICLTEKPTGQRFWHMETRVIRGGPPPFNTTTATGGGTTTATSPPFSLSTTVTPY